MMFVLSSSLKIPDPYLHFMSPRSLSPPQGRQTSYQPAQELTLSFPPFLLGELCCQGKGASFSFYNYFLLLRGIVPKLLRQHILLTLILRVSDPRAPRNTWRRLWHSQEPGQPVVTQKLSDGYKQTPFCSHRQKAKQSLNQVKTESKLKVTLCPQLHQSILGLLDVIRSRRGITYDCCW